MKLYGGNPSRLQNSSRGAKGSQRNMYHDVNTGDEAPPETSFEVNAQRISTVSSKSGAPLSTSLEVTFAGQDQYIYSIVQGMVDNVCLHQARVDSLTRETRSKGD